MKLCRRRILHRAVPVNISIKLLLIIRRKWVVEGVA